MSNFALICLILSILIYILYISIIYIKYKPTCLSESYYKVGKIFTIWILLVAILIFPAWVEISPITFQFMPFLSVVFLGVVGLSPNYLKQDKYVHIICTACSAVISIIWSLVTGNIPYVLLLGLFLWRLKTKLFWIENLAFLNIYLSILL